MRKRAHARFAIKAWDEKPWSEGQGEPKLTRASVTKSYTGDIDGEALVEYVMMYRADGSATFVGLERVVGRIGDRTGTFVLQRTGVFEGGQARESYVVISDSATGGLQGLQGEATPPSGTAWSIRSPSTTSCRRGHATSHAAHSRCHNHTGLRPAVELRPHP
jgi:hypothetical protein